MAKLIAVIFMPEGEVRNAALMVRCLNHIDVLDYSFDSVVSDWDQLLDMLRAGEVQVVVYARQEHINPHWLPRFELAGAGAVRIEAAAAEHPPAPAYDRPRARRPRIVKR